MHDAVLHHAKEDVVAYAESQFPPTTDFSLWTYWMCFQTIACFVQTLVQRCNSADALFRFLSKKFGFVKGLCVAIERLVPGTYFTVRNAGVVPPRCRPPTTGRSSPAGACVNPERSAFYHGATLTGATCILSEGWKTGLGAGSDKLRALYGLAVPGVYVGMAFSVALTFPGTPTIAWAPGRRSVNGGTLPSLQHSCPLRIVFRVATDTHDAQWRRKDGFSTQYLFRPEHRHITHM